MFAEDLNIRLLSALDRPDLRIVAGDSVIRFDPTLDTPFRVDRGRCVILGGAVTGEDRISAFHLRHALELSTLLDAASGSDPGDADRRAVLAGLSAARVAARFFLLDAAPPGAPPQPDPVSWLATMSSRAMPKRDDIALVWSRIAALQGAHGPLAADAAVTDAVLEALEAAWPLLGPAETLMAEGGDARLAVDPATGLNHYGCSHRPRPWAVTFASSTASSLSERGFGGAEASRRRMALAALDGIAQAALAAECEAVRAGIAAHYGLPPGCAVVLAASGTDLEMAALALCSLPREGEIVARPVSNVLLAPEETGTGVPMAASGRHFANDTALGRVVTKNALVEGFPDDTRVLSVAIRDADGRLLPREAVDADCTRIVEAEAAEGRTVLLHRLDLSKTGLLAPGMGCIERMQARLGDRLELVVDACQARLDASRIRDSLDRGWMVMVTGSKFFTGPPFCGALLLPPAIAARLDGPHSLPRGLADYGGASDWPPGARAVPCPPGANAGMVLRWQAALMEMEAFRSVPQETARQLVDRFVAGVDAAIACSPDVVAVEVPAPERPDTGEGPCWDQVQTIRSFLVLEPPRDGAERLPLDVAQARLVYRWLNADVTRALPPTATLEDRALARLLVHIGQPAPVGCDRLAGTDAPGMAGALRISVGARLLSGEPSHAGLGGEKRMEREIGDVTRILGKIGLLLRCWPALLQHDPVPRYAPDASRRRPADAGLDI
ncbi:hypothetical protein NFI95_08420 [Acetobacteraceae bacterium KSS8]|uniref:Aminotransferase class V-fold PLP-dependent enzyme n=1 Tax=Endosaccharibacter trunci TaxID=2812733 RepID=A0ABT1W8R2_9PROT|nr:hypothetical protein [Acetobacteraceae bacterium KSS8]